jgi:beta-N-acetylhexosaminidase
MNEAAHRVGLGLCLKHYPGLGGATSDTHVDCTDLSATVSDIQVSLFIELCATLCGACLILSHGLVRQWDPDWPVSVSVRTVADLRKPLPAALLMTDDLQMGGLRQMLSTPDATLRALRAGVDLVCVGNNLVDEEAACEGAAEAVLAMANGDPTIRSQCLASMKRVALRKAAAAGGQHTV